MFDSFLKFAQALYPKQTPVPLHAPVFQGNEKKYLNDVIDSTFVSYLGQYVKKSENWLADFVGSKHAIAVVNGTSALHLALLACDVVAGDEVITQPLTFVATCNAIYYCSASPVFVDINLKTLGLCPKSLEQFFILQTEQKDGFCYNKKTGARVKACMPMHTFGNPCEIDEIIEVCDRYNVDVIEDSAESIGSYYKNQHTGTFGKVGVFSFNGNKTVTSGGGGMLVTNDDAIAKKLLHISTTAKVAGSLEYIHDEIGFNYRMPNLNAALLLAQFEQMQEFLKIKQKMHSEYKKFVANVDYANLVETIDNSKSNYWLNALLFKTKELAAEFLKATNESKVMTRPAWKLMTELSMNKNSFSMPIPNAKSVVKRIINIPSGVPV